MSVYATLYRLMSTVAQPRQRSLALFSIPVILLSGLLTSVPVRAAELDVPTTTYPTIKAAIAAASSGDKIVVAPGTYVESPTPSTALNPTYQDYGISMATGLNITITSSGGPGVTTLDYTNAGNVNVITYQNSGQTPSSVFSGFTIKNDNSPSGAIDLVDCSATISNCVFVGCTTQFAGAAILQSNSGAGIGITPSVIGCKFENCVAGDLIADPGFGGAIEAAENDFTTPGTFTGKGSTKFTIANCQFTDNVATYDGAAIDVNSTGATAVTAVNCSFTHNVADGFSGGFLPAPGGGFTVGAVDMFGGSLTLVNCVLWGDAGPTVVGGVNSNEISTLDAGAIAQNSDIEQTGFGATNINSDPLYIALHYPNLDVPYNSPIINKGTASFGSPNVVPSTDLNGSTRTSPPDMGAWEYLISSSGEPQLTGSAGAAVSGPILLVNDSVGDITPVGALSATITWGDGTSSSLGTVTQPGGSGNAYVVSGSHTYATGGVYSIESTVSAATNTPDETTTGATSANIAKAVGTPTANAQVVSVSFNTSKSITLTGSDPDSPPLALTFAVATSPVHGTLSGTAPNLTYTPNAGFHGSDSFTFTTSNGTNTSTSATVSIAVTPGTPTANAQSVSTNFNTAKGITLTGSDPDVPVLSLTFVVSTSPAHGTLSGTAPNLTYTPNAGFHGSDSFTFTATNGTNTSSAATVSITVGVGTPTANGQSVSTTFNTAKAITLTGSDPDVPVLSLTYAVATNPTHGTLSGTAPNLTYTPAAGYTGSDSFTFTVNNGTNTSASATVSISVSAVAIDVSGNVTVTRGGYRLIPGSTTIAQTVTLTNIGSAITGPISLVLNGLSSNATLSNATGTTSAVTPVGRPYINVAGLAAGASETVGLLFSDPTKTGITYTTQILAGSGLR